MSWQLWLLTAWLAGHVIIPPVLYIGYCAVSAMLYANQRKPEDGKSPTHVLKVDTVLVVPIILLDGVYNALWLWLVCLDPRPVNAFRNVNVFGFEFKFFELATERFSRYSETPTEWRWRRWVAAETEKFLAGKDLKGWHIRKARP